MRKRRRNTRGITPEARQAMDQGIADLAFGAASTFITAIGVLVFGVGLLILVIYLIVTVVG